MCLHKQDPRYASGPKYAKILNMAKFWMSQVSQYACVEQRSEYSRIFFDRVLNTYWILNMSEFTTICKVLSMYHTIHSTRPLCKPISTYWETYSEPDQRSKIERFGKIIIVFNWIAKKLIMNLWEVSEFVSGFKYVRVLNIHKFS